ncbi:hypothetical protein IV59_GL001177 [Paucilactobacillus hokkaidonensis]|uniref:Uncharacterized protein n=1 Tax=Paucilactobacillus hokkaidonensis TaxID=1193095 RepID=A0ABR5Q6V7_9LACO|nr:hypothetical protein IV59_GL001177 [Paucilactobacillus hokkaidonensis]
MLFGEKVKDIVKLVFESVYGINITSSNIKIDIISVLAYNFQNQTLHTAFNLITGGLHT